MSVRIIKSLIYDLVWVLIFIYTSLTVIFYWYLSLPAYFMKEITLNFVGHVINAVCSVMNSMYEINALQEKFISKKNHGMTHAFEETFFLRKNGIFYGMLQNLHFKIKDIHNRLNKLYVYVYKCMYKFFFWGSINATKKLCKMLGYKIIMKF